MPTPGRTMARMSLKPVARPFQIASFPRTVCRSVEEALPVVVPQFFPHTMKQLTAGQHFFGVGGFTHAGPFTLSDATYGADLRMEVGEIGTAYHVNIPLSGSIESRHRNIDVTANAGVAAVFQPQGETVVTRWAAHSRSLLVKIDRDAIDLALAATLDRPYSSSVAFKPAIDLRSGAARSWVRLLRLLISELDDPDSLLRLPITAVPYADALVNGFLVLTNPAYREAFEAPADTYRPATIRAAVDIIHAEADTPMTTATLARRCHVKVRTLQEGFQRHLGIPPMAYLRSVRLAQAHAALQAADPHRHTVTAIARRWGFTNLTRFANQYRAEYRESPSETLRNHNRRA